MSKHTPGPWKWQSRGDEGFAIYMATALRLRTRFQSHHKLDFDFSVWPEDGAQYDEAKANIRLIASAPDLLEMLKRLTSPSTIAEQTQAHIDAVRLIAKAEGA